MVNIDDFTIIKSNRKTLCLQVTHTGEIVFKTPKIVTQKRINDFIKKNESWLEKHISKIEEEKKKIQNIEKFSQQEVERLKNIANDFIPKRVNYYAKKMSLYPQKVVIRAQKTKWGSCSSKKNLNFNCLLMLTPIEVIDSVIVHELAHIKEMNHSKNFYTLVESVYPEYKKYDKWLKKNEFRLLYYLR